MKTFPDDFYSDNGIWYHCGHDFIDYSDGADSEQYLALVFAKMANLCSDSLEFLGHIKDWPSQYHLSPVRANLLRSLPLPNHCRVLELGSGCGALTRYLGETLKSVVAVEGSMSRAALTRRRCQDLIHVQVLATNFEDLHFHAPFDMVTLIGVLEYAAQFGRGQGDPFLSLLHAAYNHLTDHGVLLLAIENQFGLKYFAGAPEDHLGKPFVGLEGYPDDRSPRTFGRLELLRLLNRAGFKDYQILLPFPDYKLPTVIVNAAFSSAEEALAYNLADWCRQPSGDDFQRRHHIFNEHLTLAQVTANGLLADLANSFLVLAYKQPMSQQSIIPPLTWICQKLNILRHPRFRTKTVLSKRPGTVCIEKNRLHDTHNDPQVPFMQVIKNNDSYIANSLSLSFFMLRSLHSFFSAEKKFITLLRKWYDFLIIHQLNDSKLPPQMLDCVPDNLLVDNQKNMHFIDAEWEWSEPIATNWVLLRGLQTFCERYRPWLERCSWPGKVPDRDFFAHCLTRLNIPCSLEEMNYWLKKESEFQHQVVYGKGLTPGVETPAPRFAGPQLADHPHGDQVQVSIIIPVFNNLELTQNCLESIWEHTPPGLYELIVVDNGSEDGTDKFLEDLAAAGKVRLIANKTNLGYAKACNQGARAARGEFLVMLNNDTLATPGWLEALMEGLGGDDRVAAVGAKLLYPDDSVQHAGVAINQAGKVYHLYRHFHRDHPAVNKRRDFQVVTGACLLIRRSVFFQVGLFDENFQNGFEDVDLCFRLRQSGYRIVYNPQSVVYHLESMTPGRFDHNENNVRYFAEKWQERILPPDDLRYYEEDGLRLEWQVDASGKKEGVIHDGNENPFKTAARACLNRGEVDQALALYEQALKFNPFDPRNQSLMVEIEALKSLAQPHPQAVHA